MVNILYKNPHTSSIRFAPNILQDKTQVKICGFISESNWSKKNPEKI